MRTERERMDEIRAEMKDKVHRALRQYYYEGLTESELISKIAQATGYRNPQSWTYQTFLKGRGEC